MNSIPDPIKHHAVQLLILLQLFPKHATAQDEARRQVSRRQGDSKRAGQAQNSRWK